MHDLIIENARIVTPVGNEGVKGRNMGNLLERPNSCIVIENGEIIFIGDKGYIPESSKIKNIEIYDAQGNGS